MAKGSGFEREMAKTFSLWWTDGKRDDIFWRTSNSGGRAGARSKKGLTTSGQAGDMGFTDPIGKPLIDWFTFEFKRGYQQSVLHDFIDHPNGNPGSLRNWEKWIAHVYLEHKKAGSKSWMIVHRRNGRQPLVMVPQSLFDKNPFAMARCYFPQANMIFNVRRKIKTKPKTFRVFVTTFDNMLKIMEVFKRV